MDDYMSYYSMIKDLQIDQNEVLKAQKKLLEENQTIEQKKNKTIKEKKNGKNRKIT